MKQREESAMSPMFFALPNGEMELLSIEMDKAEGRTHLGHRINSLFEHIKHEILLSNGDIKDSWIYKV